MSSKKLWWQMSLQVYILGSEVPSSVMGIRLLPICASIFRVDERVLEIYFNNSKGQSKESRLVSSLTKLLPSLASSSWGLHENPLGDREMMSEHHDDGRKHLLSTYWIRLYSLTSHGRKAWIKVQLTFGN